MSAVLSNEAEDRGRIVQAEDIVTAHPKIQQTYTSFSVPEPRPDVCKSSADFMIGEREF